MGWREKNKPAGEFSRWTFPWPNLPWVYRWHGHYQERRVWDRDFGRLSRSPSGLKDGWRGDRQIRLQRTWKQFRKHQYKES